MKTGKPVLYLTLALHLCLHPVWGHAKDTKDTKTAAGNAVHLSGDASDFVLLSQAVPDAILEIRYYSKRQKKSYIWSRVDGSFGSA